MKNRACETVTINFDTFLEIYNKAIKADQLKKYVLKSRWVDKDDVVKILGIELPKEDDKND